MRLFLLAFFIIYGGIHLYAFLKARAAFSFGALTSLYLMLFMLIMILAPVIVRYSERLGFELFARIMAHIGFFWGGILFLFFSVSVVIDLYRVSVYLAGLILQKNFSAISPSSKFSLIFPLLLSLCITVYGYFEARDIRTERISIKTSKIPAEIGRLKIVQISDVHLGLIVREKRLNRILDKVRAEQPDILVSTGDLVDGQVCRLTGLEDPLKAINPPYGKFAITGNHEFYAGIENARCFTENAGFTFLRGESVTVAGINIAGVDDPAGRYYGLKDISEKELLSGLPRDKFTLLLKHRPAVDKDSVGLFDLQLSGHAHKGQIFPFSLVTRIYYRHTADAGHLKLMNNFYLYVSRGSGTWGPPIRFLAPPEVTVIELVHKD
jgi:predicted MPP superfamily phosphohydrolase